MTLEHFVDNDTGGVSTGVLARCSDCEDLHAVANRVADPDSPASSACPDCGGTSYSSRVNEGEL